MDIAARAALVDRFTNNAELAKRLADRMAQVHNDCLAAEKAAKEKNALFDAAAKLGAQLDFGVEPQPEQLPPLRAAPSLEVLLNGKN